jgi:hypothetical protein
MTHNILSSHSMGKQDELIERLPALKEFGQAETFLEGRDYRHGYYTYSEADLKEFFRINGAKSHPHELEGNPVENKSDMLAQRIAQSRPGDLVIAEVAHERDAPEIIRENYRRFSLLRR